MGKYVDKMGKKIYLKIFIGIIVTLWLIYFFQMWKASQYQSSYRNNSKCTCGNKANCTCGNKSNCGCGCKTEGFTPKIKETMRPYARSINQQYESFIGDYGASAIAHKFKRWNIL